MLKIIPVGFRACKSCLGALLGRKSKIQSKIQTENQKLPILFSNFIFILFLFLLFYFSTAGKGFLGVYNPDPQLFHDLVVLDEAPAFHKINSPSAAAAGECSSKLNLYFMEIF